jgi:hypothetical protein
MSRAGPSRAISVRLTSVRHGRSGTAQPGSRPRWMAIHTVRHGLPNWLRGFDSRRPLQPADQWKRPPLPIIGAAAVAVRARSVPDQSSVGPSAAASSPAARASRIIRSSASAILRSRSLVACW